MSQGSYTRRLTSLASGSSLGLFLGLGLVLSLGLGANAADLPPEHEVRRLIIAADSAIAEERWDDASRHLGQLQNMEAVKPADYKYLRGRVMLQAGQLNEAQSALEGYVTEAGEEGKYYDQSLKLITQVEDRRQANPERKGAEPVAVIEPAQRINTGALKSLYLEDSARGALVAHLNSLLSLNAWQPGSVIRSQPSKGVKYQVAIGTDAALQVTEEVRSDSGNPTLRSQTLTVFGINPVISHSCYEADNSCWLYDPRDQSRWLKLANRPEAVAETAQVLSELIRNLQKGKS